MLKKIPIGLVRFEGGTQSRDKIRADDVQDYAADMKEGATFPPPVVVHDGSDYWLAEGFHRYLAHVANGAEEVECEVHPGTRLDAVLLSAGSNLKNGIKRSMADKHAAVRLLLENFGDGNTVAWYASAAKVSHGCASSVIKRWSEEKGLRKPPEKKGKDGKNYKTGEVVNTVPRFHMETCNSLDLGNSDGKLPASGEKQSTPLQNAGSVVNDSVGPFDNAEKWDFLLTQLWDAARDLSELASSPGGEQLRLRLQLTGTASTMRWVSTDLSNLVSEIKYYRPYHAECPYCKREGSANKASCQACKGLPYVIESVVKNCPPELSK